MFLLGKQLTNTVLQESFLKTECYRFRWLILRRLHTFCCILLRSFTTAIFMNTLSSVLFLNCPSLNKIILSTTVLVNTLTVH